MDPELTLALERMEGRLMARIADVASDSTQDRREAIAWREANTKLNQQLVDTALRSDRRLLVLSKRLKQPVHAKLAPPDDWKAMVLKVVGLGFAAAAVAGIAGSLGLVGLKALLRAAHLPVD